MKNLPLSFLSLSLLLTACGSSTGSRAVDRDGLMENPLFAERYSEELVERMVEIKIRNDDILQDSAKAAAVEKTRTQWLEKARAARKRQREGFAGNFITINEYIRGEVLYLDGTLYFDTTFTAAPGPGLHVWLTTIADPRDVTFPDETAMDIGRLESPYGSQRYPVPVVDDPQLYRTVVLWDNELERLHGFAQISK